jgi:hypothetical protein
MEHMIAHIMLSTLFDVKDTRNTQSPILNQSRAYVSTGKKMHRIKRISEIKTPNLGSLTDPQSPSIPDSNRDIRDSKAVIL